MLKKLKSLLLIFSLSLSGFSQEFCFEKKDKSLYDEREAQIIASEFELYEFDRNKVLELFLNTPSCEFWENCAFTLMSLPSPDGKLYTFTLAQSGIMPAEMMEEFPTIRAVRGFYISGDTSLYLKAEIGPRGFTAMVTGHPEGSWFIDPVYRNKPELSICYFKKHFYTDKQALCHFSGNDLNYDNSTEHRTQNISGNVVVVEKIRREYRLAVTTTGEYSQFHGGTIPSVMNAIITTVNRVNSVYERDIAIRLVLVPNNSALIFLNPSTDPFQNNNSSQLLTTNPGVINNAIGFNAYDIGHNFSTGGGGVASLGCVCLNNKAQGVTGSSAPVGDPFDIDYVAHEIGHQFGANHTQNNSCQRNGPTAWEPGSASTIMGYAGICPPNLQNNSDDYFHTGSIGELYNFAIIGIGNSCANRITTPNNAPVVDSVVLPNTVLPKETPFRLVGLASDVENDPITYTWEQFDTGPSGAPNNPSGNAPIFRSFAPVNNGTRFFPRYPSILTGVNVVGEILPTYSRNLRFRLTVRDGTAVSYRQVQLSVDANAGPFTITYPTQGAAMRSGVISRISWNVANTDAGSINCKEVDIYLSTNNGATWDHYLGRRPNTGEALVIFPPNISSTAARLRIDGVNQLFVTVSRFFNISPAVLSSEDWAASGLKATVYPNPGAADKESILFLEKTTIGKTTITIASLDGKMVYEDTQTLESGIHRIPLIIQGLAKGTYLLRITTNEATQTLKWVVK